MKLHPIVSRLLGVILVLALLASVSLMHSEIRKVTSGYPDEYRSYYIPSSAQVRAFSLGYHTAMADVLFIWFMQFWDWYNKNTRYDYMEHTFDVLTDLDPKYQEAYVVAALFAFVPLKYDYVYKFLDKGIEKNPENFLLPYDAGCYAFFSEKNYERAAKYFKIALERSPNKGTLKNLYAKALAHKGDLETALDYFEELYSRYRNDDSAEGNYYRGAAARHIWATRNAIAQRDVREAVSVFRAKHGRIPHSIKELVSEGILNAMPKDPLGVDYAYDPEEGTISCVSKFDMKKAVGRW